MLHWHTRIRTIRQPWICTRPLVTCSAYDKFKHNPYEVYLQDLSMQEITNVDDLEGETIEEN
jgi:hypothetical protein